MLHAGCNTQASWRFARSKLRARSLIRLPTRTTKCTSRQTLSSSTPSAALSRRSARSKRASSPRVHSALMRAGGLSVSVLARCCSARCRRLERAHLAFCRQEVMALHSLSDLFCPLRGMAAAATGAFQYHGGIIKSIARTLVALALSTNAQVTRWRSIVCGCVVLPTARLGQHSRRCRESLVSVCDRRGMTGACKHAVLIGTHSTAGWLP